MMPSINMVLQTTTNTGDAVIERVLWIHPSGEELLTMDLQDKRALPQYRKWAEIQTALATGQSQVLETDPYARVARPENTIPEAHRQRRDKAWQVIRPLVQEHALEIFDPARRGPLIATVAQETEVTITTLYKYLRKYWQRGQIKNALLPDFDHCGGQGKERTGETAKLGRPNQLSRVKPDAVGINMDEVLRTDLLRGLKKFYGKGEGQFPQFTKAYEKTLTVYFNRGYELRGSDWVPIMPPVETLPSLRQAQYWYRKTVGGEQALIAREGPRRFNLRHRALLGDSTQMAFGPGSVYQLDATVGDIYLVSSLNRSRIIGRPVIYIVIDVFSRLIVGLCVTLEGPSWLGAMMALENAMTDKVTFCRQYGIQIAEHDWPVHHGPKSLLADRGELEGYQADSLVNAFGIEIANTSPYRADWKGIVERNFRLTNEKGIQFLPGAIHPARERGDPDYRLEACLDLYQFRQLMILCVLQHNQHYLDWYKRDEFMIEDQVPLYPINLWNWGVQNRVGLLREWPVDIVRLNLLPHAQASVTERGIVFNQLHYDCELARQEGWYVQARQRGRWKIEVAYDPRIVDTLYLVLENGKRLEVCSLLETDRMFHGHNLYEIEDQLTLDHYAAEMAKTPALQSEAEYQARVAGIVTEARELTEAVQTGQSKRSRVAAIRANRQAERESERAREGWHLGEVNAEKQTSEQIQPPSQPSMTDPVYVAQPSYTDALRKKLEEASENDN